MKCWKYPSRYRMYKSSIPVSSIFSHKSHELTHACNLHNGTLCSTVILFSPLMFSCPGPNFQTSSLPRLNLTTIYGIGCSYQNKHKSGPSPSSFASLTIDLNYHYHERQCQSRSAAPAAADLAEHFAPRTASWQDDRVLVDASCCLAEPDYTRII